MKAQKPQLMKNGAHTVCSAPQDMQSCPVLLVTQPLQCPSPSTL